MRIYSVHIRRDGLEPDHDIVLVKEGFSWPAAMLMPLWAMWCGLWVMAGGMFAILVVAMVVVMFFGLGVSAFVWVLVGAAVLAGYTANDARRTVLEKQGFELRDIVAANSKDVAEFRFFDRHPDLAADVRDAKGVSLI